MRPIVFIAALMCVALVSGCDDGVRVGGARPPESCADVRPFADSCDGLSRFVRTAGLLDTDGTALGVTARAGLVYVADGDNGLLVVDACDPAHMVLLGRVETPGSATDVAVSGAFAYVACARGGLAVVDVRDPRAPAVLGTARGSGAALDVDVVGEFAYVADDAIGLIIYNVGNPFKPVVSGVENTPGEARGVCVRPPVAYVADGVLGLRIVSVLDPENPWLVNAVGTPGAAADVDVDVDAGLAYVADGAAGLTVVDVASIPDAAVRGRVDTADLATDVRVRNGVAYLLDRSDGLLLFDVDLPDTPVLITRNGAEGDAAAVALARDYAYVADGDGGLRVVDVRRPEPPPVLSQLAPAAGRAVAVLADGNTVYVSDDAFGLHVDEWQGGALGARGSLSLPDGANNALLEAGYLYVSGGSYGVFVVDVGDPDRPVIVGTIPGTGNSFDVAIADSVCLTARSRGLGPTMFDQRTLANPTGIPVVGVLVGVEVGKTFAYFASVNGDVYTTTRVPPAILLWTTQTGTRPSDLVVRDDGVLGETLYLALESGALDPDTGLRTSAGVAVYGLADPKIPEFEYLIETSIPAQKIAFSGDYLYVAGEGDGLEVFDITDPMAPLPVGSYWRTQPLFAAAAVPGAILMAAGQDGLLALPPPCDAVSP